MEFLDRILLIIHISAGFTSLAIFWVPVFAKKGGALHNRAGRYYMYAMWVVVVTAALLSIINLAIGDYITAAFLGFLTLLTGHPLWYAVAILKYKKDIPADLIKVRKIIVGLLVSGAVGLVLWSILLKLQGPSVLLLIFGILGLTQLPILIRSTSKLQANGNWMAAHINGMITSGIAAYTAFFAFGGSTFFEGIFTGPLIAIPWSLPSIIGTVCISWQLRKRGFTAKAV